MAYIYKKTVGGKGYYYLRASVKRGSKMITKDIAYLGGDIKSVREKLASTPKRYSKEIRKAYRTINKFIEANHYLQRIKSSKIKTNPYIDKGLLEKVEACRLHWNSIFQKLDKKTKDENLKSFIIEFAFNTTSIEGNTITLKEAQKILTENLTPKNRTLREIYDVQNTERVFFELLQDLNKKVDHELICYIHDNLLKNVDERKGYRTDDVRIFQMKFKSTPAPYVLTDMKRLIEWYNKNENKLHPLALATIFHHKFEKIHPFMDGNGRTGRILANYILMSKGYPPAIFRKRKRPEYIMELNKADKSGLTDISTRFYKNLIKFVANEMVDCYWNIFL